MNSLPRLVGNELEDYQGTTTPCVLVLEQQDNDRTIQKWNLDNIDYSCTFENLIWKTEEAFKSTWIIPKKLSSAFCKIQIHFSEGSEPVIFEFERLESKTKIINNVFIIAELTMTNKGYGIRVVLPGNAEVDWNQIYITAQYEISVFPIRETNINLGTQTLVGTACLKRLNVDLPASEGASSWTYVKYDEIVFNYSSVSGICQYLMVDYDTTDSKHKWRLDLRTLPEDDYEFPVGQLVAEILLRESTTSPSSFPTIFQSTVQQIGFHKSSYTYNVFYPNGDTNKYYDIIIKIYYTNAFVDESEINH